MTWLGPFWCRCCSSALVCQARHESPLNHTTVAVCFKHSQPTTTTSSLLKCVKRRLQLVLWYFLHNNCLAKINQHLLNFQLLKVKILTTKVRVYIIVGNDSETKVWPTSNFWINVIPHKCYFPAICRELIGWFDTYLDTWMIYANVIVCVRKLRKENLRSIWRSRPFRMLRWVWSKHIIILLSVGWFDAQHMIKHVFVMPLFAE